jgi:hypothetical protein
MAQSGFHNNSSLNNSSNLPIIDRLVQTYKCWQEMSQHFPKKSRYTMGSKIDHIFISLLEFIFTAGSLPKDKKLPYIQKAVGQLDLLKFFLRISWEIKAFDDKKYLVISEPLDEIGKMLGGWHRNLIKETSAKE